MTILETDYLRLGFDGRNVGSWLQTVLMAAAVASPVDDPNWTFCPRQHAVAWRRHQDRRPARGSGREGDGMKRIALDVLLLVMIIMIAAAAVS